MIAIFFWILLLVALVFGYMGTLGTLGMGLLIWVLFGLLGLKVFGNPLS